MNFLVKAFWVLKTKISFGLYRNIGRLSYIANPIFILGRSRMVVGNKVRIFPGARIEVMEGAELLIEDNVSIGPNVNITVARRVLIGAGTTISANVFITDMDHDIKVENTSVMDTPNIVSSGTNIGRYCFIGTGAVILAGACLDDNVVVGANSVVKGCLKMSSIYAGSPARFLKNRYDI